MKELLIETMPFQFTKTQIEESMSRNDGRLIVSGVLQRANARNQNGRVYPKPILEREVGKYTENEIKQRRALGELDHPDSSIVNLRNVSHNILEVWWDGDDLCGKIEVLDTPAGNILKALFKAGITLGISSRGMGSVKNLHEENGEQTVEVQPDFEIVCWDFVSNPSTHGAYLYPVNESKQHNNPVNSKYDRANQLITEIICEISGVCCI